LVLIIGALLWPASAQAHPLGNFTVNRYSRLELGPAQVTLTYIVDMAEIPTFQTRPQLDLDGNGAISPTEEAQYLGEQVTAWQRNLILTVQDRSLTWRPVAQTLAFAEGQGGLPTMRLSARFAAALPAAGQAPWPGWYQDNNFAGRLGWQEVVVQAQSGVTLLESTVPSQDISQELRRYPQDLLQSPLSVQQASFRFAPDLALGTSAGATDPLVTLAPPASAEPSPDPFAALITLPLSGPWALLLALVAAFGWGAAHALTPGHGKTIVAAYLVGSRGTVRHAILLGLTTTLTHTTGVFLLGLFTLFAAQFILPEQLYPWLGVISGVLVVGIGLALIRNRLANWSQPNHSHDHDHHHHHSHDHSHDHHHHHHHDHGHHHHLAGDTPLTWRSLVALGISGGIIPCPSALVVMLSAIALQRIGLGLILIVAFSLGLAAVLTGIGILWVQAGRWLEQLAQRGHFLQHLLGRARWLPLLPLASALLIILIGGGITLKALLQTGLLN
jgi:ABC-type nickel/cobalt efflux system permease component RcnA